MSFGKACQRLRKSLLFSLVCRLGEYICFRCGKEIVDPKEFSIDHKIEWLDSSDPVGLFFDLDNIAYSHLICNSRASRKPHKKYFTKEERINADREITKKSKRRNYTKEKRRKKYIEKGY
jgi:hypothetical protein